MDTLWYLGCSWTSGFYWSSKLISVFLFIISKHLRLLFSEIYSAGSMKSALFLLLLCLTPTTFGNEDYYELLGVNKDADNREIRKAFKKLAVSMHPDKNQARPYIFFKWVEFPSRKVIRQNCVYICLFLFYNCAAHEQTLTMIYCAGWQRCSR